MDVDTIQEGADPFACPFKIRRQRHSRPLRPLSREPLEDEKSPEADSSPPKATDDNTEDQQPHEDQQQQQQQSKLEGDGAESGSEDEAQLSASEDEGISMAEILRRRKQGRVKKAGLDFNASKPRPNLPPPVDFSDPAAAEKDAIEQDVNAVINRFTQQTGTIINVDEHMMKYIDSELQRRRLGAEDNLDIDIAEDDEPREFPAPLTSTKILDRRPGRWPIRPDFRGATLGRLQEIDLGAEHTKKNVERTIEAKRRMANGEPLLDPEDEEEEAKKRKKKRNRRTSIDIERDKLVEEVLKESRLDIYEEPDLNPRVHNHRHYNEDYAADDRIAEQFKREFMDALNARRRGKSNHNNHKKRDETKKPRGPKLGGSRAARAAMRESQRAADGKK